MLRLLPLIAALLLPKALASEPSFVFVHGAWVGEWYWDPITKPLRAQGHSAVAVSLTGHGARAAQSSPKISLTDHVADVVRDIQDNDLHDVILVAHSYGGRPATGAWDQLRGRVSTLVFIEAVAPYGMDDIAIPADRQSLAQLMISRPDIADSGLMPAPDFEKYRLQTLMPQSIQTLYGEVKLTKGPLPDTPGIYVIGAQSRAPVFRQYAQALRQRRGWRVITLDHSGHDVAYDAPDALVALLLRLAGE